MTEKDDLFKGIDDAADNLFGQYLVKKPQSANPPAGDAPAGDTLEGDASQNELEAAASSFEIEPETSPSPGITGGDDSDPMAQMEEALLSIDWDVNQTNLAKGREILRKVIDRHGLNTDSPGSQVAGQMDKVLTLMQDNPETVPVSAPSDLRKALEALRDTLSHDTTPGADTGDILADALAKLQTVVASQPDKEVAPASKLGPESGTPTLSESSEPEAPEAAPEKSPAAPAESGTGNDFGMKLSLESEEDREAEGTPVAEETSQVLKDYSRALTSAIKSITPMEKLFANRDGMEKLYSVNKHIRERLASQVKLLSQTFSGEYSSYTGLGTVNGWLESQLDILNPCIKRLVKVENLFGKTKGYEKLYELTKKIRTSLNGQQEAITTAVGGTPVAHQFDLTGEYPALQPVLDRAPAAAVTAVTNPQYLLDNCLDLVRQIEGGEEKAGSELAQQLRDNLEKVKTALAGTAMSSPGAAAAVHTAVAAATDGSNSKCRWDWLLKTSWGSQLVGLAPEQVVFESSHTFPLKDFRDKTHFSLKKLKTFPWTNLQSLFSGDLAEVDKARLNAMELEIAKPPETFRGSTQKKVYLAIMYHESRGKVFLLDSPTEAISIAEEGLWAPGKQQDQDIAGILTMYGSIMPVIALE